VGGTTSTARKTTSGTRGTSGNPPRIPGSGDLDAQTAAFAQEFAERAKHGVSGFTASTTADISQTPLGRMPAPSRSGAAAPSEFVDFWTTQMKQRGFSPERIQAGLEKIMKAGSR
jgi:hypothetical protein